MLIWTDAWSFEVISLFVAELQPHNTHISQNVKSKGTEQKEQSLIKIDGIPFPGNVKLSDNSFFVLHLGSTRRLLPLPKTIIPQEIKSTILSFQKREIGDNLGFRVRFAFGNSHEGEGLRLLCTMKGVLTF